MPIDLTLYGGFLVVATLAIVSPGPDTILIIRYTLGTGYRTGFAAVIGVQLGLVIHGFSVALGLSLLITSIPITLKIIAIIGAIYLAFMAFNQLRHARQKIPDSMLLDYDYKINNFKALRNAMLTNLLNPKVIMLFIALMPGFTNGEHGSLNIQFAILAATMIAINTAFQLTLVGLAHRARMLLSRAKVQRLLSLLTAVIFFCFSLMILFDHAF